MKFEQRLSRLIAEESAMAPASAPKLAPYSGRSTRNDFLTWLYQNSLVRADALAAHLSDKLFFAKLLAAVAPEAYASFHPRTFSLTDLGSEPAAALSEIEIVAKPAAGMNGEGGRVYLSRAEFLQAFAERPELFGAEEEPSPLTGIISSGARYLVQERLSGEEFRLHTFEGRVVEGATFTRWDSPWRKEDFLAAETAMQRFLDLLPRWLVRGQAWSADFLRTDKGFRLLEINTNRGQARQWSGDLSLPDVLGAYTQHLTRYHEADFSAAGGPALLAGEGNLEKYIAKFGAEAWARHQGLRAGLER